MKKVICALLLILSVATYAFGEIKTDTLYYDGKWKGVETPAFATYMRVMSVPNSSNFLRYRDYYITGELEGEGNYISIDKNDDSKSILDGEYEIYYKSGELKEKGKRIDGKMDGEFTSYDTNGLILCHSYYKDGQLNGIFTEFIDNGNTCIQTEYENGVPLYDYYTVSNQNGDRGKIRLSDNRPIYESPSPDEKIEFYNDGYTWQAYRKNGIVVGMTNSTIKDYGKYYQITVVITNNSMSPIIFDTDNIEAFLAKKINKYDKKMKVLSADDYMTKVKHKQRWNMFLNEFAEGLAAASAGFSSSTTYSSFSGSAGGQRYHGSVHSTS
ncbi:MAG: hypothetical protein LUE27_00020, partial [Clostridia bacterium]|nr:hypothetical protein [Clostridia bacterium]